MSEPYQWDTISYATENVWMAMRRLAPGPAVAFLPWSIWRRVVIELGRQAVAPRIGVVADMRGHVYVAHDSLAASVTDGVSVCVIEGAPTDL